MSHAKRELDKMASQQDLTSAEIGELMELGWAEEDFAGFCLGDTTGAKTNSGGARVYDFRGSGAGANTARVRPDTSKDDEYEFFAPDELRIPSWDCDIASTDTSYMILDPASKAATAKDPFKDNATPTIFLAASLHKEIMYICQKMAGKRSECGGFMLLRQLQDAYPHYLAYDHFMVGQEAHATVVDMDNADMVRYISYLKEKYPEEFTEGNIHHRLLHWHLHPSMGVGFSGTDTAQQEGKDKLGFRDKYRFYACFNEKGDINMQMLMYYPVFHRFTDVNVGMYYGDQYNATFDRARKKQLDEWMDKLITVKSFGAGAGAGGQYWGGYGGYQGGHGAYSGGKGGHVAKGTSVNQGSTVTTNKSGTGKPHVHHTPTQTQTVQGVQGGASSTVKEGELSDPANEFPFWGNLPFPTKDIKEMLKRTTPMNGQQAFIGMEDDMLFDHIKWRMTDTEWISPYVVPTFTNLVLQELYNLVAPIMKDEPIDFSDAEGLTDTIYSITSNSSMISGEAEINAQYMTLCTKAMMASVFMMSNQHLDTFSAVEDKMVTAIEFATLVRGVTETCPPDSKHDSTLVFVALVRWLYTSMVIHGLGTNIGTGKVLESFMNASILLREQDIRKSLQTQLKRLFDTDSSEFGAVHKVLAEVITEVTLDDDADCRDLLEDLTEEIVVMNQRYITSIEHVNLDSMSDPRGRSTSMQTVLQSIPVFLQGALTTGRFITKEIHTSRVLYSGKPNEDTVTPIVIDMDSFQPTTQLILSLMDMSDWVDGYLTRWGLIHQENSWWVDVTEATRVKKPIDVDPDEMERYMLNQAIPQFCGLEVFNTELVGGDDTQQLELLPAPEGTTTPGLGQSTMRYPLENIYDATADKTQLMKEFIVIFLISLMRQIKRAYNLDPGNIPETIYDEQWLSPESSKPTLRPAILMDQVLTQLLTLEMSLEGHKDDLPEATRKTIRSMISNFTANMNHLYTSYPMTRSSAYSTMSSLDRDESGGFKINSWYDFRRIMYQTYYALVMGLKANYPNALGNIPCEFPKAIKVMEEILGSEAIFPTSNRALMTVCKNYTNSVRNDKTVTK